MSSRACHLTQRCVTGGFWHLWMCRYLLEYIHLTKLKIKGLMEACLSQSILPRSTNWLEGFLVMSRIDRFVCQQTFAVHRSTNVQRYMLGVKMCITAIPQQSILTDLSTSSQPESLCLSYKHFLCVCVCFVFLLLVKPLWTNHINNWALQQFITLPDRGR